MDREQSDDDRVGASMLVKFKSNMHKPWWELTFSNINSLIRQIADESWPTKKSYTKVRLLKHIRLTHIVVTSTINKMFTQNMCLESLLRPHLGFWILEKLDFAGFWKSRFRTKYRWCCLDIWILVADFVYFDACIPSIPLLGFLSCYILHIVKKPLIVLFHVHPCFFIFCGCAYLLCPVVFSWTRMGRSGAAARVGERYTSASITYHLLLGATAKGERKTLHSMGVPCAWDDGDGVVRLFWLAV